METTKRFDNETIDQVVYEIVRQLTAQTIFMLGAKGSLVKGEEDGNITLSMKIKGSRKVSHLRITYLYDKDEYKLDFFKMPTQAALVKMTAEAYEKSFVPIETFSDIGPEQFHSIIEEVTGLHTKL
jgi:hypothetical protein